MDSYQTCIRFQTGTDICAVPSVDAVVTGEVDCYSSTPLASTVSGDD